MGVMVIGGKADNLVGKIGKIEGVSNDGEA